MSAALLEHRIATVRRFNRFYTQKIGVLQEGLLESPFSLAEARVLYELAHRDRPTASDIARDLSLDPGYLSRMLRGFQRRGLVRRQVSASDARQRRLSLTPAGRAAFAPLDTRSREDIGSLLGSLPDVDQQSLVAAMTRIERLLSPGSAALPAYVLRPHRPGDIGWITWRHGVLYAAEYGWDERFEAMVAAIMARFVENFDVRRECCWIAEQEGEPVGSVALVDDGQEVARLRVLLVEPRARGHGIGRRLVAECVRFARRGGYRKIVLSTYSVLAAARRIYEAAGFRLVERHKERAYGKRLISETWEIAL
ncbi:MAG: MarR family transcriptional regulator [Alphaproteobacteria bacterium]|nr:MarR family transcriptional regulator [Alphaproteobacteria bacterium]MBV9151263.1 MarR family transcriptional regulator [Alphaproteobacteria bacterium]